MRIHSEDIPQADDLLDVLRVVKAVSTGSHSDHEIADAIDKTVRQGRYYRLAAEILGFMARPSPNKSMVTKAGKKWLRSAGRTKKLAVASAVLNARVFQCVIPFLEAGLPRGRTRAELVDFLKCVTQSVGLTTMGRRVSTVIAWLRAIDMLVVENDRYVLRSLPQGIRPIQYVTDDEPLLPSGFALAEYQKASKRLRAAAGVTQYAIDLAKTERANKTHGFLTDLVAAKICNAGAIPRCNKLVDLASRIDNRPHIFEIKSTTAKNAREQIRHGISQLYEYRYLQGAKDAKLVLVIEKPVPDALKWMVDYVVRDRGIWLAWDGDRKKLHVPDLLRDDLAFLLQ